MKNSTLNRMLVAMLIALGFAATGCITPEATKESRDPKKLEPVAFDAATLLHNKSWALSCLPAETSDMDAACAAFVSDRPTVFSRILHAHQNGEAVLGLSAWRSDTDFNGCGGIDLTDDEVSKFAGDGVTFDAGGVTTGASYVDNQDSCATKDGLTPKSLDDLKYFYDVQGLRADGVTYKYEKGRSYQVSPGCQYAEVKAVTLLSYDGVNLIAAIIRNDQAIENNPGDCSGVVPVVGNYLVQYTQQ